MKINSLIQIKKQMKNLLTISVISLLSLSLFGQTINWQSLNEPGNGGAVTSIKVSPYNSNHILLGGDIMGASYSNDGGLSWNDTYGFNDWSIAEFTWHPTDSNIVWAGTMSGPFKSLDGGANWQSMRTGMDTISDWEYTCPIQKVLFDPQDITHLLAFGGNFRDWYSPGTPKWNVLWESTDSGNNWTQKATIGNNLAPGVTNAIYVGTKIIVSVKNQGIFISTDNGSTWNLSNTGLSSNDALWVTVSPTDTNTLYCSTNNYLSGGIYLPGGVFKSVDGGASWSNISTGLEQSSDVDQQLASYYRMVKVSPTNSNVLYTANGGWSNTMTYKSTDAGNTWSPLFTTAPAINTPVFYNFSGPELYVFDFDPNDGNTLIGGNWEYVLKTTDGGVNWDDLLSNETSTPGYFTGTGFTGIAAMNFEFNPYNASESVYQGMDDAKFVISKDNMTSWKRGGLGMIQMDGGNDVVFAGTNGTTIYCTSGQNFRFSGVYKSTDGGDNWTLFDYTAFTGCTASGGQPLGIYAIPNDPNIAWVVVQNKIFLTLNGGVTWTEVFTTAKVYFIAPATNSPYTFYVNSANGVYKTTDGVNFSLMSGSPQKCSHIVVDPNNDNIIYVTKYKTDDGEEGLWRYDGVVWNMLKSDYNIYNVAVQPGNSQVIMVITNDEPFHDVMHSSGVWISTDGGTTWEQQNEGLPLNRLKCVTFNPHQPNQVVVGLEGRGFYKTNISSFLNVNSDNDFIFDVNLYPNPAQSNITVSFSLKEASRVQIKFFDIAGKYLKTLIEQDILQGNQRVQFELNGLATGIYNLQINVKGYSIVKKLIIK